MFLQCELIGKKGKLSDFERHAKGEETGFIILGHPLKLGWLTTFLAAVEAGRGQVCGLYPEYCCPNCVKIKADKWPIRSTLFGPFLAKYLRSAGDIQGAYADNTPCPPASQDGDESASGLTGKWEALICRWSCALRLG